MTWWISILFYLWQNSLRRWWEQPLSLLSKLVISGLLGLLGAVVILGMKHLGDQLNQRLNDREILAVVVTEIVPRDSAPGRLLPGGSPDEPWEDFADDVVAFLIAGAYAETDSGERIAIWASEEMEAHGMIDDFYLLTPRPPEGVLVGFSINEHSSEAITRAPTPDMEFLMNRRGALIGGIDRLAPVLGNGFTKTSVMRARSVGDIARIHEVVDLLTIEGRRTMAQSNLAILRELEKVRDIQLQSLLWITIGSSVVLGLVFGSLAWMEFREERYLLALLRCFGVGRWTLLGHSVVENVLLAVGGVLLGFGALHLVVNNLDLAALQITWLGSLDSLYEIEGRMLVAGAAAGGLLSCIPIGIGLRKPLGLVLK